jgi:hypothetical protein
MARNSSFGFFVWILCVGKKPNVLFVRWQFSFSVFFLSLFVTVCAKNRAGYGTLSFLLAAIYFVWFIIILLFCPLYF